MILANVTSVNIREISKRDKKFGLSYFSWYLNIILLLELINFAPLIFIVSISLSALIFCYVAEFFDDAFFLIMLNKFIE